MRAVEEALERVGDALLVAQQRVDRVRDAEQLLVFGHQKADREVAERLINNLVNEKLRDGGFAWELFSQRKKLKRPADQYKQSTKKDGTEFVPSQADFQLFT